MEKRPFKELFNIAEAFNIPGRDDMSKPDLLVALRDINPESVSNGLAPLEEAQVKYKERQQVIRKVIDEVQDVYSKIAASLPNIVEDDKLKVIPIELKRLSVKLQDPKSSILIFGDTKAGKSSFINLLLGVELVPVAAVNCTSCITEIEYGQPSIQVRPRKKDYWEKINVNWSLFEKPSDAVKQYIRAEADNRLEKFPYDAVKLTWHSEILRHGLVLVDSPGLNEKAHLDEVVKQYIGEAVGIMYLINMRQGVSDSAMRMLLEFRRLAGFNLGRLFFVGTMIDEFGGKTKEEVAEIETNIKLNLRNAFQNQHWNFELNCISSPVASLLLKFDLMSPHYSALISKLVKFLVNSFTQKLRWVYGIIYDRLHHRVKFWLQRKVQDSKKEKEEAEKYNQDLANLRENLDKAKIELDDVIAARKLSFYDEISRKLDAHRRPLKFQAWETLQNRLPPSKECTIRDHEKLHELARQEIAQLQERMAREELTKENFLENFNKSLLEAVITEMHLSKQALTDLEKEMTGDYASREGSGLDLSIEEGSGLTVGHKVAIGVTAPVWVPLAIVGGILVGLPWLIGRKIKEKRKFNEIAKNPRGFVEELVDKIIDEAADTNSIEEWMSHQFLDFDVWKKNYFEAVEKKAVDYQKLWKILVANCEQLKQIQEILLKHLSTIERLEESTSLLLVTQFDAPSFDTSLLKKLEVLSSGTTGVVYKASLGEEFVAVKAIKLSQSTNIRSILRELAVLKKLDQNECDYIVQTKGTFFNDTTNEYNFLLEYIDNGNLEDYIGKHRTPNAKLSVQDILILLQVADGMTVLKGKGIAHRDLKPSNILLTKDPIKAKICDFGLAKDTTNRTSTLCGTLVYMAPEIIEKKERDDSKTDVYAFGLILWQMWHAKIPFSNENFDLQEFFKRVVGGLRPAIDSSCSPALRDLIQQCWHADPDKRPSWETIKGIVNEMYVASAGRAVVSAPAPKIPPPVVPRRASQAMPPPPRVVVNKEPSIPKDQPKEISPRNVVGNFPGVKQIKRIFNNK